MTANATGTGTTTFTASGGGYTSAVITTTEVAPFRLLSYSIRKKQALVIPAEGVPHLEETPANPPMPVTAVTVSIAGSARMTGPSMCH